MEPPLSTRILRDAVIVVAALIIILAFFNIRIPWSAPKGTDQPRLEIISMTIGDKKINVEIARTPEEQEKGLSFRKSMGAEEGMVFPISPAGPVRFWMYGMQFPLDMIFIRDGRVVDYEEDIPAPSETQNNPAVVTTLEETDLVLEVNAGKAKEWDIRIGTPVVLEQ